MKLIAEKILLNLAYTDCDPATMNERQDIEKNKHLISASLDVLALYTGSYTSCSLIAKTDIMM